MQAVNERPIVKTGKISVTSLRVTIGAKTYAMSSIASVRIQENEPKFFLPVFSMLITGICFALVAASDMQHLSHFLTWGLYLTLGAFILFLLSQTTKYSVRIRLIGSVEELNLLETSDRAHAEEVVQSIREAIMQRE